jgi:restriction endonuclease S subunit
MAGRAATASIIPGRCAISVGDPHSALPPGWQWVPLSEIAELGTGHTPSRNHPEYWGGDIPWIGIRDARAHHGGMITDTIQTVTELGLENSSARLLPKNTVCLSRTASVGYVVIMGRPMATSQDFVTWSCGSSIDPRFLMNALLAEGDDIRRFGEGSTHTTIYFPEVKAFHISLPPLSEQQRIVAKIDVLSSKSKGAHGELDCIRQLVSRSKRAILDAAFRGALTAAWRTAEQQSIEIADEEEVLKKLDSDRRDAWSARAGRSRRTYRTGETPKWFPDFSLPAGWHWVSVDQIVACTQYGTSAKTDSLSSGLPVLRMGNLQDGTIDFSSLKYLPRTHQEFPNLLLQPGDVLFNRTNSPELVGKAAVFPDGVGMASFASYLIRLRPIGYLPNLLAGSLPSG